MSFAAQDLAAIGIPCQKFSPLNIRTKLLQYNPFAQMLDGKLRKGASAVAAFSAISDFDTVWTVCDG